MMAGLPAHNLRRLVDAGDVVCEDDQLEAAQDALAGRVAALLQAGAHPVVLGGGHEIAWGSFQGLRRWLDARGDREPVLVLNLDAHFDLRTGRPGSSGTPFDQIAEYCAARGHALQYACLGVSPLGNTPALYARAAEVGAVWVEDRHMQEAHLGERLAQLDTLLAAAGHVYLTIDLDVLPAATAPGSRPPRPMACRWRWSRRWRCMCAPAASCAWPTWPSATRPTTSTTAPRAWRRAWRGACWAARRGRRQARHGLRM